MISYAPGSRVVIRDEEWLVRRVDPSTDAGKALYCDGISELVRGRSAIFLTNLEGEENILVLDPAQTELVPDTSSCFNSTLLYLEARLRQSTPNDDRIHLGHRGVMNLTPYQLDPALQALRQPRQRILIADAVGLGKTLEAGVLASELIQRGRGRRILVITLKSMLTQFQKEFWSRFSIPLVRLDSVGLQRVRNQIPSNHNPFNFYDRSIISIDTLKNNLEYRNYLENAWWDIIIIDECHNVAARARESGLSRRAKLARMLSTRSDTLILLSATPHDGSARSFASLMSLLDPTAISDPDDYTPGDYQEKGLVIRRFKKDIRDQVREDFQERLTEQRRWPTRHCWRFHSLSRASDKPDASMSCSGLECRRPSSPALQPPSNLQPNALPCWNPRPAVATRSNWKKSTRCGTSTRLCKKSAPLLSQSSSASSPGSVILTTGGNPPIPPIGWSFFQNASRRSNGCGAPCHPSCRWTLGTSRFCMEVWRTLSSRSSWTASVGKTIP